MEGYKEDELSENRTFPTSSPVCRRLLYLLLHLLYPPLILFNLLFKLLILYPLLFQGLLLKHLNLLSQQDLLLCLCIIPIEEVRYLANDVLSPLLQVVIDKHGVVSIDKLHKRYQRFRGLVEADHILGGTLDSCVLLEGV